MNLAPPPTIPLLRNARAAGSAPMQGTAGPGPDQAPSHDPQTRVARSVAARRLVRHGPLHRSNEPPDLVRSMPRGDVHSAFLATTDGAFHRLNSVNGA